MTTSTKRQGFRISILSIWIGILIPIVAASIPYALKYIFPEHRLEYEMTGPIIVDRLSTIGIIVCNKGEKTEKNINIWIDTMKLPKISKGNENLKDIIIDSKSKYSVSTDGNYYIISIGDLRPNEKVKLSMLLYGFFKFYDSSFPGENFSIKSNDSLAQNSPPSEEKMVFYQFGFWMFILFMIIMGVAAIYTELIMHPKKKEKYLINQLEKVRKKIPENDID
jgi:hypothetical protein